MELTLIESTHTYVFGDREIPGCTRCLDISGLIDFSFVKAEILMRRSVLGTEAHRACTYFSEGTLDKETVDPQVQPFLDSWIRLCEKTKMKPELLEHQCVGSVDGLRYGMRCDFLGQIFNDEAVIDIKIGQPHFAHGVQLAGYAIGLPHLELSTAFARFMRRKRYGAYLQEDGSIAHLKEYKSRRDYQTFHASLEITDRKMTEKIKVRRLDEAA